MDPYQILEVNKHASSDEIRNAYRRLAKKHHPDLNPKNIQAEKKFKEIALAYEILGDPKKRAQYDQGTLNSKGEETEQSHRYSHPFYHQTQNEHSRYSAGFDAFDPEIFETIFGREAPLSTYMLEVDFADAVLGAEREFALPTGKRLKIKIPPGIESGARLRLKGQGEGKGDAVVEIRIKESLLFKRVGKDIQIDVPISLKEAILGAEIQIPTLEGPILLKIPTGVNTDSKLRVKGKGVPQSHGHRGDQIVRLKVILPDFNDPDLTQFMRQWKPSRPYQPRERILHSEAS